MKYPLIIALDPSHRVRNSINWCINIIRETNDLVIGYKIGLPLIIKTGVYGLEKIIKNIDQSNLVIADLKLADIGEIMIETIKPLINIGIDTYIVHGFIGYSNGLEKISKYLEKKKCKLITIVSMTHSGSSELIDKNTNELINIALKAKSWGVVSANKKEIIEKIKKKCYEEKIDLKILTPGIGIQGSEPGSGLKNGADYEIIGRLITRSRNPRKKLIDLINKYYRWIK